MEPLLIWINGKVCARFKFHNIAGMKPLTVKWIYLFLLQNVKTGNIIMTTAYMKSILKIITKKLIIWDILA